MDLTLREFEDINAYSNSNVEKVIASTVNSSSNAVFISMFEDSVILLDHDEGMFYIAEYSFDPEKLTVEFDNFEPVDLIKEEDDFRRSAESFFEDDDMTVDELTESYKNTVMEQDRYISDLIQNALMAKDTEQTIDYKAIKEAVDEVGVSIINESYFKEYQERLYTHPLTEAKLFNWEDRVVVSLVETESVKLVNESAVERAKDLWKDAMFKERFEEASTTFIEDVEAGTELFTLIFEDYPQVYFLDNADRKTLFGKTCLNSRDLREDTSELVKGLEILFESFDLAELRETYLVEAEAEGEEGSDEEEAGESEAEEKAEKKAKELTPAALQKIADELKKVAEKLEDESLKEKIDGIIEKLELGKEEGTRPEVVKEAVSILSL